jgi:hypothetical protein
MEKLNTGEAASATAIRDASARTEDEVENRANRSLELTEVRLPRVVIGRIVAIRESGEPLIDFPGNASGSLVPARSLTPIPLTKGSREVALTFEDGDASKPVIVGLLQGPQAVSAPSYELRLDDESLLVSAKKEVVIQCGKASITLTSAGKILIQGEYVVSRSSGVNKIRGGSIQLN